MKDKTHDFIYDLLPHEFRLRVTAPVTDMSWDLDDPEFHKDTQSHVDWRYHAKRFAPVWDDLTERERMIIGILCYDRGLDIASKADAQTGELH